MFFKPVPLQLSNCFLHARTSSVGIKEKAYNVGAYVGFGLGVTPSQNPVSYSHILPDLQKQN